MIQYFVVIENYNKHYKRGIKGQALIFMVALTLCRMIYFFRRFFEI